MEPKAVNKNTVARERLPKDLTEKTPGLKFIQNMFPKNLIRIVEGILIE
jgi:hypothetical protein